MEALKAREWSKVEALDERSRALCQLADKLSGTPTKMMEPDWEPLRQLGFDDQACLEVAHIVGMFNHLTRLADGLGLALDPDTVRAAKSGTPIAKMDRN